MCIIALDLVSLASETPDTGTGTGTGPVEADSGSGRDAVFRSALASYIADYARHRSAAGAERWRRDGLLRRTALALLARVSGMPPASCAAMPVAGSGGVETVAG